MKKAATREGGELGESEEGFFKAALKNMKSPFHCKFHKISN